MENLIELIDKDQETISNYLGDVSVPEFIEDVKNLLRNSSEKVIIEQAIKRLQSLL